MVGGLVLNYVHQGGTDPNLIFKQIHFLCLGEGKLGDDEQGAYTLAILLRLSLVSFPLQS